MSKDDALLIDAARANNRLVTLASIVCEFSDCEAMLEKFRDENPMLHKATRIHAEFVMRELIH